MKLIKKKIDFGLLNITLAIIAYIVFMSFATVIRYKSFRANAFDMAIEIQTIWNTSQGRLLEESINLGFPAPRFWVAHWEFIFIPIALFFKILPSPLTLLLIQTTVLALGAIPVYKLTKDKLKSHFVGICFAFAYLLYPAMQNANLCDIHGLTFSTPMLLFAFYFLQKRDLKFFGLFAFLSLMCREDVALILFMFGLYAIFILKEKKLGVVMLIISLIWFLVFFKRTAIRLAIGLPPIVFKEGVPGHLGHLKAIFDNPLYLINHLAKKYNIKYIVNLFGPIGFLSLFSPFTLILAAPTLSINLLSNWFYTHDIQHQYTSTITPIVFISAIYGSISIISFMEKKISDQIDKIKLRKIIICCISVLIVTLSITFWLFKSNIFKVYQWKITKHHKIIDEVISLIPPEASLSAGAYLAPHAAMRRELYVFPQHMDKTDFVLYDFNSRQIRLRQVKSRTKTAVETYPSSPLNPFIKEMLSNRDYGIFDYRDGVILFKKGFDYEEGLRKLAIAQTTEIPHLIDKKNIGGRVSFVGYKQHRGSIMWFYSDSSGLVITKIMHFTVYWKALSNNLKDFDFVFNIQNAQARFTFSHSPVFGLYPTSKWKENEVIRDEIFWEVPQNIKTGNYSVSVYLTNKNGESMPVYLFEIKIGHD